MLMESDKVMFEVYREALYTGKDQAKEVIEGLLKRMNDGEKLTPQEFEAILAPYMPPAKSAK